MSELDSSKERARIFWWKRVYLWVSIINIFISMIAISYFINSPVHLKEPAYFILHRGDNDATITETLHKKGLIRHPLFFKLLLKGSRMFYILKSGEYQFKDHVLPFDIIKRLNEGRVYQRFFSAIEGQTIYQIMNKINQEESLSGEITQIPAEGSILADTYAICYGDDRQRLINRMKESLQKFLAKEWEQRDKNIPISSIEEAVVLASIVEKETGLREEKSLIAGVYYNRLKKGMKLDADPTTIYGITKGETIFNRRLLKSDLKGVNPYNTYLVKGLPPTPICVVSKDTLRAVLHPASTNALYFIANGLGGHTFSHTLDEHNNHKSKRRNSPSPFDSAKAKS